LKCEVFPVRPHDGEATQEQWHGPTTSSAGRSEWSNWHHGAVSLTSGVLLWLWRFV